MLNDITIVNQSIPKIDSARLHNPAYNPPTHSPLPHPPIQSMGIDDAYKFLVSPCTYFVVALFHRALEGLTVLDAADAGSDATAAFDYRKTLR